MAHNKLSMPAPQGGVLLWNCLRIIRRATWPDYERRAPGYRRRWATPLDIDLRRESAIVPHRSVLPSLPRTVYCCNTARHSLSLFFQITHVIAVVADEAGEFLPGIACSSLVSSSS